MIAATCSRDDCTRPRANRDLCRPHYQAAWKAGTLPPREHVRPPVTHVCPPDHRHGETHTCYKSHRCHCDACRDHQAAAARTRNRQQAYGTYDSGRVPAAPVREHVRQLLAAGMGHRRIAELADVGRMRIRELIHGRYDAARYGQQKREVLREHAERILAVTATPENLAPKANMPALGARRRVQALVAIGHSQAEIARRIGKPPQAFSTALRSARVTAQLHLQIAAVYEELWNTRPPTKTTVEKYRAARSLNRARAAGWLPPLAWDDIDHDPEPVAAADTEPIIDEIAIELACAGETVTLTPAERREALTRLHRLGLTDGQIAQRLNIAARSALRIRQELQLPANVDAGKNPVRAA